MLLVGARAAGCWGAARQSQESGTAWNSTEHTSSEFQLHRAAAEWSTVCVECVSAEPHHGHGNCSSTNTPCRACVCRVFGTNTYMVRRAVCRFPVCVFFSTGFGGVGTRRREENASQPRSVCQEEARERERERRERESSMDDGVKSTMCVFETRYNEE